MRQSIGGAWLFSISITLMMFIIAYVAITMDYSNAYQLKNDVVLVLEEYNGLNKNSAKKILSRVTKRKYITKINCQMDFDSSTFATKTNFGAAKDNYWVVTKYQGGGNFEKKSASKGGGEGYLCIYKFEAQVQKDKDSDGKKTDMVKAFYAVSTGFGFNFPILGEIFDYRVTGETSVINYPDESGYKFD